MTGDPNGARTGAVHQPHRPPDAGAINRAVTDLTLTTQD
jgi:hypothetical protein